MLLSSSLLLLLLLLDLPVFACLLLTYLLCLFNGFLMHCVDAVGGRHLENLA